MSATQTNDPKGDFEHRLLAELTDVDARRPAGSAAVAPRRPRPRWQPVGLGVAAALVVAGAVVAGGVLSSPHFEPYGDQILPGEELGVKGDGCAANAAVEVQFDGAALATTTADGNGAFHVEAALPAGVALGSHELQSRCASSGGAAVVQHSRVTVVAARPTMAPEIHVWGHYVPGGAVFVKGGGMKPGTEIAVSLDGSPSVTVAADALGSFDAGVTLTAETAVGPHVVVVTATAADGTALSRTFEVRVTAP